MEIGLHGSFRVVTDVAPLPYSEGKPQAPQIRLYPGGSPLGTRPTLVIRVRTETSGCDVRGAGPGASIVTADCGCLELIPDPSTQGMELSRRVGLGCS